MERYRLTPAPIVNDAQKLMALQNFFAFGHTIYQFTLLQTAALNSMSSEYLKILPLINRINDNSNKLILSKITKQEGYRFAGVLQDSLDELAHACEKYFGLVPPMFQQRSYSDVRAAFIATPLINTQHAFEQLVIHRNNDSLLKIQLADCRDPANFGALDVFKKQLAEFLLNLGRHRDDPVVSVSKKFKWGLPNFVISAPDMIVLREKLLTKIDEAQLVRTQKEDEHKQINRAFLESKYLPKISIKTGPKFLRLWQMESPNFRNPEARINTLRN